MERNQRINSTSSETIDVVNLGRISYREAWQLQKDLQQSLIRGEGKQTLLLCEHNPVITSGKSAKLENILHTPESLALQGTEYFAIERGGDVTWHGPGQLVGYPILNLNFYRRDVGWYMRTIEEILIVVLKGYHIDSIAISGKTGVWTKPLYDDSVSPQRKIASIGVRLSRWCTMHGFALNVLDCTSGFSLINPCGFTDIVMTSIEQEFSLQGRETDRNSIFTEVVSSVGKTFVEVFSKHYKGVTDHASHP